MSDDPITYSEHAADILTHAVDLADQGKAFALVASLKIEGGAAREVGSLAVVTPAGQMTGYLSNGCIDQDIVLQAQTALSTGQVISMRYGEGSSFMDLKLPCGGALELLIDPDPDIAMLRAASAALQRRETAELTFSTARGGDAAGTFTFGYAPKPALILAGRGAILRMTAKLVSGMDFDLTVASPEEADLAQIAKLDPHLILPMTTPSQAPTLPLDANTGVLLLFHDHEWEQQILLQAACSDAFFVGAMGSRRTHQLRLFGLQDAGLTTAERDRIRGPIGLVPSLRNASLIAVSALAEVIAALPPQQWRVDPPY